MWKQRAERINNNVVPGIYRYSTMMAKLLQSIIGNATNQEICSYFNFQSHAKSNSDRSQQWKNCGSPQIYSSCLMESAH